MKEDMNSFLQYPVMSTLSPSYPRGPWHYEDTHLLAVTCESTAEAVRAVVPRPLQPADGNQTVVEIIDNGPGIPPQNRSHIFEPFFTTKEGYTQEREKLIQLGAMAAGLAHELNNPATAARRAAADLRQSVEKVQHYACELNETLSVEQWQQLVATSQEAVHCATSQPKLNSFEQSDREEAIECWLDSQNVADAWELAPALVNARIDQEELEALKRTVPAQDLQNAIQWLAANLTTCDLLKSISHSTERISELVGAVKSYSFKDQAPWQEIDVHEGIENTLIILGHKLRNVTVTRDFDRTLPRLCAYGGELNQVWTNLIDNAIYASGGTGRIDVRTRRDGEFFLVEIADNGSGIPPEARPHIFAVPFFTTKGGSGTGLGLVISHRIVVERHHGKIDFSTGPDGTQFNVRLPFESPAHA